MKTLNQFVFYGLAIGAQKGFSFLLLPIATSVLTSDQYGELNFLTTISAVLSLVLTFGQSEMLFRFVNGKSNLHQHLFFALSISVVGSLITLVTALILIEPLQQLIPLKLETKDVIFLLFNLSLCPFIALLLAYYRLQEQAYHYFLVAVLQAGSQTLFSVVLLYKGYGTTGVMFSGLIATLMIIICFVFPTFKQIGFTRVNGAFSQIKSKLSFSVFITASSLCLYAANGLEHWFIAANYNAAELAYYFVAAQLTLIGSFMFEPVRMWWYAKRYQLVEQNRAKYEELVIFCLAIALVICVLLSLLIPIVINSLLPNDYERSTPLVPILILALAFRFKSELLNVGCYLHKDAAIAFWINFIVAMIATFALLIFSHSFGLLGIAYIILAVQLIRFVLFYCASQRLCKLDYPIEKISILWIAMLGTLIASTPAVSAFVLIVCVFYLLHYATKLGITDLLLTQRVGDSK